jgi:hypothetical protein
MKTPFVIWTKRRIPVSTPPVTLAPRNLLIPTPLTVRPAALKKLPDNSINRSHTRRGE